MNVRLKLFSVARDIAGFDEQVVVVAAHADADAVLRQLVEAHPALEEWKGSLRLAVNCEYVNRSHRLNEGDEVAVIPPVSGG
ncbi:MAG TPA: MoaD/ThiS family protein [Bacteroidota bacterium]|nr:MoaD/ThiS family protein [Bacteroidota bacterium]